MQPRSKATRSGEASRGVGCSFVPWPRCLGKRLAGVQPRSKATLPGMRLAGV